MSDFILSTCSTADISAEEFEKRNIHYIGFHFRIADKMYTDDLGQTMSFKEFYSTIDKEHDISSSQVNIDEYLAYFETFLKEGKDILHYCLATGISGTYNSAMSAALIARERYPERRIEVFDSVCASGGLGLFMSMLADLRDEGRSMDEIIDWAESHKLNINHLFFSTDLSFFVRGGRISKAEGLFGGILNICPLLNVSNEGKLVAREKLRGKKQVIRRIVKKMAELTENGTAYDGKCYLNHSDCIEDAEAVITLIEETFPALKGKIVLNYIGTTIGIHTGRGTIALFFYGKERID